MVSSCVLLVCEVEGLCFVVVSVFGLSWCCCVVSSVLVVLGKILTFMTVFYWCSLCARPMYPFLQVLLCSVCVRVLCGGNVPLFGAVFV